jgi:hypothetical protein
MLDLRIKGTTHKSTEPVDRLLRRMVRYESEKVTRKGDNFMVGSII